MEFGSPLVEKIRDTVIDGGAFQGLKVRDVEELFPDPWTVLAKAKGEDMKLVREFGRTLKQLNALKEKGSASGFVEPAVKSSGPPPAQLALVPVTQLMPKKATSKKCHCGKQKPENANGGEACSAEHARNKKMEEIHPLIVFFFWLLDCEIPEKFFVYARYFVKACKLVAFFVLVLLILHPRLLLKLLAVAVKVTVLSLLKGAQEAAEDTLDYALRTPEKEENFGVLEWLPSLGFSAIVLAVFRLARPQSV